jgi:uncharacterized membrane protein YfcA
MSTVLMVALAGIAAQFVDGALGMGYGLTSSTLLIAIGLAPALASATVHLAEVGTTAASAIAHHRFGNVDWRTVTRVAVPGALGALIGATVLSNLSLNAARPWASTILFALGIFLLIRFTFGRIRRRAGDRPGWRLLTPLGLVGGFIDATGGGGWGPVTTPTLMADGRLPAHRVIGTVSASEFLVSLAASVGFLLALGTEGIHLEILLPLLIGGIIAAPLAAAVVRKLNTALLGVCVGGVILFTNGRTILTALEAPTWVSTSVYSVIAAAWIICLTWAIRRVLRARRTVSQNDIATAAAAPDQTFSTEDAARR